MNAITIADKLVSISKILIVSALFTLPLNAQAEYYLVYGPPAVPVACDYCNPRPCYRSSCRKVHRVYKHRHIYRYRSRSACRAPYRPSHYSMTVYYPVPVYPQSSCYSCGGFMAPTYYWAPAPYQVYYANPNDRLVGNRYEDNYYDPSLDTGTADNDIYY